MSNAADLAKIKKAEIELVQLEAEYGKIVAEASLTGASMLPPPAGTAADIASLTISLSKGNWGDALLDAVGFIPIAGDVIKGGIKGTKIANKMKNVEIALEAARAKLLQKKLALKNDPKELQKTTADKCNKGGIELCPNMGGNSASKNDWKEPVDYTELKEPRNVTTGGEFTRAQLKRAKELNMKKNGGQLKSDIDGSVMDPSVQSKKGVPANMKQVEGDHITPRNPKKDETQGSNSNENLQLIKKSQNLDKSNKQPK